MFRALLAGRSGLKNHQIRMDIIGHNIANMNTVGYKAARVEFVEGFAQLLAGATESTATRGSTNPKQVGSGSRVGSIETLFGQGSLEATGQVLDLAIQGRALFALRDGDATVYSRAGNFRLDGTGRLLLGDSGRALQGVNADANGNLTGAAGDIVLNPGEPLAARKTSRIELRGNLDAAAEVGTEHAMAAVVYDELGRPVHLTLTFTARGDGEWDWTAASGDGSVSPAAGGTASFSEDGTLESLDAGNGTGELRITPNGGRELTILVSASGTDGGLKSRAGSTTAAISDQDGMPPGELIGLDIGQDGTIAGIYSNGETRTLARVLLATVNNPSGLARADGTLFEETAASGPVSLGFADAESSAIISGALESSNVDISDQFTDMIVAQRGFQANARVITSADQMISELIHINR